MTKYKKKFQAKKSGNKSEQVEPEIQVPSYSGYVFGILLIVIFAISLYLRIMMPYDSVFRNGIVAFASDDAVFHMRLVENTLHNFPHRIFYDPFTRYPYGSPVHFGPLFTQMIATLSLIVGMGSYNMDTVNTIGAFFPAILGALMVFPVYSIGKNLGSRSIGLLAALMIAVLPGQFFSRSTLGFTDHHIAEVFFSTTAIAFFILSMKSGREINIRFSDLRFNMKPVVYSLLAGIMLAAFQLSWTGAPFFSMIFLIFIIFQYIIDDMRKRSTDYLAVATVPIFFIDLIFVLPYINIIQTANFSYTYSWLQVAVPIIGMGFPLALSIISMEIKKRGYNSYYYPVFLGAFFILCLILMKLLLPQLYDAIISAPTIIFSFHTGGAATIAEASSILERPGMLWSNFPITGPLQGDNLVILLTIAVLTTTGYGILKRQRSEELIFFVWTITMLLAMYGQNRWAYYFAVNAALLVGIAGGAIINYVLKTGGWQWRINPENIGISQILSLAIAVFVVIFFVYPSAIATAIGENPISRWGGGEPSGGGFSEWLETLTWMRYNTPDPGMDYLASYKVPKNMSAPYQYPDTAYGVMSWWDYGHVITYWGHRIPNANPFQAGIGGGTSHLPGASTFLTAKTEEDASNVLYALGINGKPGARYVVSNAYMAFEIMQVFGIWNDEYEYYTQIRTNAGMQTVPSKKYYELMEAKLHIFDGNGLHSYRLVHESQRNPYGDEQGYKNIYNMLYGGNIPVENSGLVKVFEFVKGAKITGRAPPNAQVTLTNTIKTNIGRTFQYSQTTTSDNGTYVFTVPYSTTGPVAGETNFDTQPEGLYTVTAGNITRHVDVSERDVLDGGTVTIDLLSGK